MLYVPCVCRAAVYRRTRTPRIGMKLLVCESVLPLSISVAISMLRLARAKTMSSLQPCCCNVQTDDEIGKLGRIIEIRRQVGTKILRLG